MPTVHVAVSSGPNAVTAYYVERGLAVTKAVSSAGWRVIHLASGLALEARAFGQRQQARAYQVALLALPVQWTLDKDALLASTEWRNAIREVHNQYR
jgi:hypothetical protein